MQLVQWIHKIAKANNIMYPVTVIYKAYILIGNETMEYGKLFQIATACEKMKNKKTVRV